MRPFWSGYINFGLVNIPVDLYSAEKNFDLQFHMLDERDHSRIRYQKINETTKKVVPLDKIVKAYEYEKNKYIVVDEEDFKKASIATKTIAIENFVGKKDIEYEYFERPYYLVPTKEGVRSYVLLREALKKQEKLGIAKVVLHEREHLVALIPSNEMLVLDLLRFKRELRNTDDLEIPHGTLREFKISSKELEVAEQLINSMTSTWQPEIYHDEYSEALLGWITKKVHGKKPREKIVKFPTKEAPQDLIALMKQSIQSLSKKSYSNNVVPIKKRKTK
jgi:DNA end-binding protein Ku